MGVKPAPASFFLETASGRRYCLYWQASGQARAVILFIHPFAEEMNKSRRMVAEMCRQLSAAGFAVLQIDLAGCGDSEGDFADASWQCWMDDVDVAVQWLQQRCPLAPLWLWGMRLGALLAACYASSHEGAVRRLLLWAPVLNGEQFLTQFLRLRVASQMLTGEQGSGTQALVQQLAKGESVEVAGYMLAPSLALPMANVFLSQHVSQSMRVDWLELLPAEGRALPPVVEKLAAQWRANGSDVRVSAVVGSAFWSTQEITDVPALWHATLSALEQP